MKTLAMNRSRGNVITSLLVVGGLLALYAYFRRGGDYRSLVKKGRDYAKKTRTSFGRLSNRIGPTVVSRSEQLKSTFANSNLGKKISRRAKEIPTSPEDLDTHPSV